MDDITPTESLIFELTSLYLQDFIVALDFFTMLELIKTDQEEINHTGGYEFPEAFEHVIDILYLHTEQEGDHVLH